MHSNLAQPQFVTEEEYLAAETLANEKHEYLNGLVYPLHHDSIKSMAGASDEHVTISLNMAATLKTHLRGTGCYTYISDMRVKAGNQTTGTAWFYPDVMVSCDAEDKGRKTMKESPILVIEVLSKSTRNYDRGDKFSIYRSLPSLREYTLIYPDRCFIEIFRLNEHQRWELFSFDGIDSNVEFASIDLRCTMAEVYENVDFIE